MLCNRVVVLETQYATAPLLPEPEYPCDEIWWISTSWSLALWTSLLCSVRAYYASHLCTKVLNIFSCNTITKITSPKQPQVVPCLLMAVIGHSQKHVLCYIFRNILLVASLACLSNWHLAASKWLADRACTLLRQRHSQAGHGPPATVRAAARKAFITWKVHGWTASEN